MKEILNRKYGINDENLDKIVEEAKDFALFHGVSRRTLNLPSDARVPLTFCLVPSFFPQKYFHKVVKIQKHINFILHRISRSKEILKECLSSAIEVDEFTRNIYKIFEVVENKQQISLGLIRTDYLLHSDCNGKMIGIKQVENNTIASSFGGVAPVIKDLHEYVLDRLKQSGFEDYLPQNESCYDLAKGLLAAWDYYHVNGAVILFVVEEETLNICDQRALEYKILYFDREMQILRCTFKELRTAAFLKENILFVKGKEVAVVYYRAGYVPEHYLSPQDWETRLIMEQSKAVKCPSAGLHLAGTKKVQAYLCHPGVLEKFVSKEVAEELREVFVGQYTLEVGPGGDKAVEMAVENPENFVLKPEREGGGNNIYGVGIKNLMEDIKDKDERRGYILMEKINPPPTANVIIQGDKPPVVTNVVPELGVFGVILGDSETIYENSFAGHLMRSKASDSNECGVAAGFGALDSPYLKWEDL